MKFSHISRSEDDFAALRHAQPVEAPLPEVQPHPIQYREGDEMPEDDPESYMYNYYGDPDDIYGEVLKELSIFPVMAVVSLLITFALLLYLGEVLGII